MDLRLALIAVIFLTKDSNRANCPLRSEVSSLNVPVTLLELPAAISRIRLLPTLPWSRLRIERNIRRRTSKAFFHNYGLPMS